MSPIKAFTDYPFKEIGDTPHTQAAMRQVVVLDYDGDKYATIAVDGRVLSVKRCYLYTPAVGRECIPADELPRQKFEIPCWIP